MKLLGVSGGPDSMLMLFDYRKKNVVVAHVNYHMRQDSDQDEKIVRDFCQKHNITLEVLDVKTTHTGNFQAWARKTRYQFFAKIYQKYNCKQLLLAHNMDDFIETALMQQQSGRTPRFFGIKARNLILDMNIYRPYLGWLKDEMLEMVHQYHVQYYVDSSNQKPIYQRNKIRMQLSGKSHKEKKDIYHWFRMSNRILKKKFRKVDALYKKWSLLNYEIRFFKNLPKHQQEVIYEYIHDKFNDIKLSSSKIKSLIDFINGYAGGKIFKLNNNWGIKKKNKHLITLKINK